ncbi:MAG: YfcE family phosphodiesterase, partial [Actinomycetota bacterium]|nr:YfcE family phosphodiesterase [Actinomycetota bacterium]
VFEGTVAHIIHAGDVGAPSVLDELETIAPVTAVFGNTDGRSIVDVLEWWATPLVCGRRLLVVHEPRHLRQIVMPPDTHVVVTGHTHRPEIDYLSGVLHVNPGSTFQPRGPEGRTVALIDLSHPEPRARIVSLDSVE